MIISKAIDINRGQKAVHFICDYCENEYIFNCPISDSICVCQCGHKQDLMVDVPDYMSLRQEVIETLNGIISEARR